MAKRRNRQEFGFISVFLGLVLGFFIGSAIVFWYTSRDEGANLFSNAWDYIGNLFEHEPQAEQVAATENEASAATNGLERQRNNRRIAIPDPLAQANVVEDSILVVNNEIDADTIPANQHSNQDLHQGALATTVGQNEAGATVSRNRGQMRIAQERLIHIRAYNKDPESYSPRQSDAIRQLDSLLGGSNQLQQPGNFIIVEFWVSPINARGYIFAQNKLQLFGLQEINAFGLETDGTRLFVRYADNFYVIGINNDFTPFAPAFPDETVALQQRWP